MMNKAGLGLVVTLAAVISAALIVALLPLLQRYALVRPNARSSHRQSTPQGAGVAVVIAASAAIAFGAVAGLEPSPPLVLAAFLFIAVVGAWDDLRTIEVAPRLLLQTVAIVLMLASLPPDLRIVPMLPWWLERAMLLVGCLWFVNLTNFMDGIDWMTVAEFVPIALGLAFIGVLGGLPLQAVVWALALCGGLVGFAPFNRPVARIFLGDVGSLPIGLLFAWLLVLLAGSGHLAAAIILPLYYVADTSLTLLRRIANREPFWTAHRTHFYQRATDHGWSVPQIVAHVFMVNVALVILATSTVIWPTALIDVLALLASAALTGWLLWSFARRRR